MLGFFRNLFRTRPVKPSALLDQNGRGYRMRNAQFVSFLQQSGFRKRQLDRHEKNKRLRRIIGFGFAWCVALGFVWVVIESAQALELF